MTQYRIYISDDALQHAALQSAIMHQLKKRFEAATVYRSTGLWAGKTEPGIVAEVILPDTLAARADVMRVAEELKAALKQDAVLVTQAAVVATVI